LIASKRFQLLRDIAPNARRLAMLTFAQGEWRTVSGEIVDYQSIRDKSDVAARDLGFEFRRFEMAKPADLEPLLDAIAQWALIPNTRKDARRLDGADRTTFARRRSRSSGRKSGSYARRCRTGLLVN